MKATIAVILTFSTFLSVAEEPEGSLPRYIETKQLTSARASMQEPIALLRSLQTEGLYSYLGNTQYQMRAEEAFLAEYVKQLAVLTDKNPETGSSRSALVDLLNAITWYIWDLDGHRNYDAARTPAFAEWLLFTADPEFFHPEQAPASTGIQGLRDLSVDDIRVFIRTVGLAREDAGRGEIEKIIDKSTIDIISKLSIFESHLNEDGKKHFRLKVVRFLDDIFVSLYL